MARVYGLSEADKKLIEKLLAKVNKWPQSPVNQRPSDVEETDQYQSTDIYVVYTPANGIPGMLSSVPGSATCRVYQVIPDPTILTLSEVQTDRVVYNVSLGPIPGSTWIVAGKDKFGKWQVLGGGGDVFFPARIDCRVQVSGNWTYSWTEMKWSGAISAATVLSGGRVGYTAPGFTVTQTQIGTSSLPSIQTLSFCGPTPRSGTWDFGGATGLAFDASAATVQTALRALGAPFTDGTQVTVTGGPLPASFVVTFGVNGAQTALTGSLTGLLPSTYAWPACELNNHRVALNTIVWMKRGYTSSTPATVVLTKTASGDGGSTYAAFSLYTNGAKAGSYTVTMTLNGVAVGTAATIYYGQTAAVIRTAIETASGKTLSAFSGSGTLASPWTFTVTTDAQDYTLTADGSAIIDDSGYRFQSDWPSDCALATNIMTGGSFNSSTCVFTPTYSTLSALLNC